MNISIQNNVYVVVPYLQHGTHEQAIQLQQELLNNLIHSQQIEHYINWYYTPMAVPFTRHLQPVLTVYDCMDELAAFKYAPYELLGFEKELLQKANIVFTGGYTIYQSKKDKHSNIYPFPSSIDKVHFMQGRQKDIEPEDQKYIPHPRLGFYGVIDERFDIELIRQVAEAMPEWQFVLIGPVVKIHPDSLPKYPNIHYPGGKKYDELPAYLSGWDIALIPFAINESTKFISPTKTPEYLAAGKPVISTPITDVINPYGNENLVHIAATANEFITAATTILQQKDNSEWLQRSDAFLANISWDKTWSDMVSIMSKTLQQLSETTTEKRRNYRMFNYIIVGAGFAGCVLAERLASQQNKKVLILDKRDHIGGNAYDYYNKDGILVHKYGPHIFHTNSRDVYEYLSQFTPWRTYYHKVLASVDGQLVPMPINLNTINQLYGLNLSSDELDLFFQARATKIDRVKTSEDVVLNKVGKELYEKFFKGYTKKMWDLDPSELDASVTARVPTRNNRDDRYFTDTYQVMPLHGYTKMFQRMLDHPNIKIMLNTDYKEIIDMIPHEKLIYTGPIDSYFNFCFGKLPYRSLEFKMETIDAEYHQTTGTVNYPNEQAFTRITDFKYLTGQQHAKTAIMYEFPKAEGDPYYPIPRPENAETYKKYQQLAASMTNTYFTGRLATYKYYNMDQVVAQSLTLYKKITQPLADIIAENNEKVTVAKVEIPESLNVNGSLKHVDGHAHNGHNGFNSHNGNGHYNHSNNGHTSGLVINTSGKENHGLNTNSTTNSSK